MDSDFCSQGWLSRDLGIHHHHLIYIPHSHNEKWPLAEALSVKWTTQPQSKHSECILVWLVRTEKERSEQLHPNHEDEHTSRFDTRVTKHPFHPLVHSSGYFTPWKAREDKAARERRFLFSQKTGTEINDGVYPLPPLQGQWNILLNLDQTTDWNTLNMRCNDDNYGNYLPSLYTWID